ncbi:hypothetical protein FRB95_008824 [Tulasnella sp. JGI-2019a]|nr:hypothetical protein FRB93_012809 [Tulasnella sp. JGI-2019a]KAG9026485.1 hypothetical protein FRB95_008824 [Tulasnella sp. JGI-2019a]
MSDSFTSDLSTATDQISRPKLRAQSAHPMLFIPELLLEFMPYLHDPDFEADVGIDYVSINSVGLVCKAWREPSLAIKWRKEIWAHVLYMLVPVRVSPELRWVFVRTPTRNDWYRFEMVAGRLHTLVIPSDTLDMDLSVLAALGGTRPDYKRTPFENLRGIDAHMVSGSNLVTIIVPRLPIPSLTILEVGVDTSVDAASQVSFLQLIPDRFPSLSTLKLWSFSDNKHIHTTLRSTIRKLGQLRHIFLHGLSFTNEITAPLSAMPALEIVEFEASGRQLHLHHRLRWADNTGAFTRLSHLKLHLAFDEETCSILRTIATNHSLQRLSLTHYASCNPQAKLDAVISAITQHSQLRELELKDVSVEVMSRATFRPLGSCGAMESLEFSILTSKMGVRFADHDLGDMLQHLPNLKTLRFSVYGGDNGLTLFSLVIALRHCPLLEDVGLYVDARQCALPAPNQLRTRHHNLYHLNFMEGAGLPANSGIDSAEAVAAFLSSLSTRAIEVRGTAQNDGSPEAEKWCEVSRIFQKALGGEGECGCRAQK